MAADSPLQYTIRNVPRSVDRALRRRARETGKSLNQVAVEALMEASGEGRREYHDLDFLIGSLGPDEAKTLERELDRQRKIDEKLWR